MGPHKLEGPSCSTPTPERALPTAKPVSFTVRDHPPDARSPPRSSSLPLHPQTGPSDRQFKIWGFFLSIIAPRSTWGPHHPNGDRTLSGLANEWFIHHTVTKHLSASAKVSEEITQMRVLERVGYSRFGHAGHGISYNVVVFPSGRAYQGVTFNRRGAHTDGRNSTVRSIAFAGNYTTKAPTKAALETAAQIIAAGDGRWVRKNAPIRGHRDIKPTACPGNKVYEKLGWFKTRSQQIIKGGTKPAPAPAKKPAPAKPKVKKLDVDGKFGRDTIERFQQVLGTVVDRVISSQPLVWKDRNPGLTTGWQWRKNSRGSLAIRRHQEILKARGHYKGAIDGKAGPQYWTAVQHDLGTIPDGRVSYPSMVVKALQKRLNQGKI